MGQDSAGVTGQALSASWPRRSAGTLLGCVTGLFDFLHFLVVGTALGPFLLWPLTRAGALGILMTGARRLMVLERRRRAVFFGDVFPGRYRASDQKVLRYLAVRSYAGLLCGVVIALLGFGIVLAGLLVAGVVQGSVRWDELLTQVLLGGVLLFLNLQGLHSLAALDARLAREHFGPSERELLQRRIHELAASRAAVVQAVDAERRRIERDLHDGIQQRMVALAMLLGRARRGRSPEQADAMLRQAHQESQDMLAELREVTWRVYPSALDSLGLEEALGGVSERCGIPVRTEFDVGGPLPQPVATAAYFVVSESVTNAAKHSRATAVSVRVVLRGRMLAVQVQDNGKGGADPTGGGLSGLRSRVAALDGVLRVDSPEGGPTTITAELPCA
ncbi:sensor histidine kinase [Streptomyces sp. DG2A-72]|uniref:sensor histidine kinase n=1 Tax=Streptomyces sp. DG2A-72 TaxID=3051386 RepID=UPI00265B72AC|nr:sensor histidine kinase [Streptomyces sp. DG2A-72]MDO0932883.1 sensor histidine kinase [Streptomyces sp. DG2A-72]